VIAALERVSRNLALELGGRSPFHQIPHYLPVCVFDHDVDERVWIAELERNEIAFDGHRLILEVRGGK
jgi:hypothetical protein